MVCVTERKLNSQSSLNVIKIIFVSRYSYNLVHGTFIFTVLVIVLLWYMGLEKILRKNVSDYLHGAWENVQTIIRSSPTKNAFSFSARIQYYLGRGVLAHRKWDGVGSERFHSSMVSKVESCQLSTCFRE